MAFQADQKVKVEIMRALGTEQLFRLLSDPDSNVLMKTLGLLRNLLSTRPVRHTPTHTHTQKKQRHVIIYMHQCSSLENRVKRAVQRVINPSSAPP